MSSEARFGVWLHQRRVGTLNHRENHTWLTLEEEYVADPERHVLGLIFEDNLNGRHSGVMQLPVWFSNLLPEGRLRALIANDSGSSSAHEMQLLAHVGHDLPGAVRVLVEDEEPEPRDFEPQPSREPVAIEDQPWRFSLAGVAVKFSMVRRSDKLRLPASGMGGDWIVKFPDPTYEDVPKNEYAMMRLASLSGMNVPAHILVHRDEIGDVPESVWRSGESVAYAVKRFDRGPHGSMVHMEDLAQVRNFPARHKYAGTYESVAGYVYRGFDSESLLELVRRLTFNVLISNGDAHLKNWSLLYVNPRRPSLSPVYDLVSTAMYASRETGPERMALKLNRTRKFEAIRISDFRRLGSRVGADGDMLADAAADTVARVNDAWPAVRELLEDAPSIAGAVDGSIKARTSTLLRTRR